MNNDSLSEILPQCGFQETSYLIFSENVGIATDNIGGPMLHYSHLVGFAVTLILGLFVLLKGQRSLSKLSLVAICFLISGWAISNLAVWATERGGHLFFFWSLTILFEPLLYCFAILLFETTRKGEGFLTWKRVLLIFAPALPVIILLPTRFALVALDGTNCDRDVLEGGVVFYYFLVDALYLGYIAVRSLLSWRDARTLVVGSGLALMLMIFSASNIFGSFTQDYSIENYNLFGVPIFVALLAYSIVKFKTFDVRILGAQVLIVAALLLVYSTLLVQDLFWIRWITAFTLVTLAAIGFFLIRGVKKQVALRERAEALSTNLEIANLRLLELDKQKTEFVSLASHQLRGPLTAIKGYASMLNEGDYGVLPMSAMEILGRIQKSAHDMAILITDYLDVTRIELGKVKYAPERFSLRDLLSEVEKELLPNTPKHITLAIEEGADPRFVFADRNKIKQVIGNLIDNSVKYTPQGSVAVSLTRREGYARIEVKDTGVGINKSSLPQLFQKFARAQNASKSNIKGTGLGLYIAKTIADYHRGHISAASEGEGKGSTFVFELPLADEQSPSAKAA